MNEDMIRKITADELPLPVCVVNSKGKILSANSKIDQVFLYSNIEEADFFQLTGVKVSALTPENNGSIIIERNGRKFSIVVSRRPAWEEDEEEELIVYFDDVTGYEDLKQRYDDEKLCVMRINIDNYDEFTAAVPPETVTLVKLTVDNLIRGLTNELAGTIDNIRDTLYIVYFQGNRLEELRKNRFAILDEVRAIETGADFPLSLSIGVGVNGSDVSETAEFSMAALDLALSRGGDQAVIRDGSEIEYYGGKVQAVGSGSKGKSRIVGLALRKLIEQSDRVFIIGHRNADMDAIGAALGVARLCMTAGTECHIVLDEVNESMQLIYETIRNAQTYNIISAAKAKELLRHETLLVVVDTSRPGYLEAPELPELAQRVVVIDHHRRGEDFIENPTLSYIETYASSASELVTEMLQYTIDRRQLAKLEADALLAGITLDTNRFAVKTGVRTFEAAAWLRRAGADTTDVKKYFQFGGRTFAIRSRALAAAEFRPDGLVFSVSDECAENAQIINAQVADELLNVKGVRASFVIGKNEKGITCISARSLGQVNVQVILEKLGGGGHLNTAGAQVEIAPREAQERILEIIEKENEA
ncbi:MAG: DHH family phosphoesterase [Firmicutes bacterium]|nr:DHH family phosphoesterase [Bacillota bacterium]